ncbi:hypothetical protein QQZ08_007723 [Neonectria magnoliae]|uniref:Uncharacterized protein n=1 Tax=Neonectria magnoliae TaxID=2732573 RepID=A0ABR1HYP6_9HYPO
MFFSKVFFSALCFTGMAVAIIPGGFTVVTTSTTAAVGPCKPASTSTSTSVIPPVES